MVLFIMIIIQFYSVILIYLDYFPKFLFCPLVNSNEFADPQIYCCNFDVIGLKVLHKFSLIYLKNQLFYHLQEP
jgi:hypothetical protein